MKRYAWLILVLMAVCPLSLATAQAPINADLTLSGSIDFSGALHTAPCKVGASAATPETCLANKDCYVKTDATPGQQLFLCNATGTGFNLIGDGGGGAGDVSGPAVSVDGEFALFDSTTGKLVKRATGTGVVTATAGVYGTTTDLALTNLADMAPGTILGNNEVGAAAPEALTAADAKTLLAIACGDLTNEGTGCTADTTNMVTAAATLTANRLVLGGDTKALTVLGSLGTTTTVLHGNAAGVPSWGAIVEADLGFTDVSTANASPTAHGLLPKLSNNAAEYLNGQGAWTTPGGGGTVTGTGVSTHLAAWTGASAIGDTNYILSGATTPRTYTLPDASATVLTTNADVTLAQLVPASAISVVLGRGSAAGAGDFQEITLGDGLAMTNQVLNTATSLPSVTSVNSTTIPASATLTKTADKLNVFAATTSSELADVLSNENATGGVMLNPLANPGELLYGGAAGVPTALASGTGLLMLHGTSAPSIDDAATVKSTLSLDQVTNTSDTDKWTAPATLTQKTFALDSNTLTGTLAEFQAALQADDFVGVTAAQYLTNKRIAPRAISSGNPAALDPDLDDASLYKVTALAQTLTVHEPCENVTCTNAPTEGDIVIFSIYGAGAQTVDFDDDNDAATGYTGAVGLALPTTTVAGQEMLWVFKYDSRSSTWPLVGTPYATAPLAFMQGGIGSLPGADDQLLVSDSTTAATWRTLTDCTGANKAVTYATASNGFGCNTISALSNPMTTAGDIIYGEASGVPTRLAGAVGVLRGAVASAPSFGTVDLSSGSYVTNVLAWANGGMGTATPLRSIFIHAGSMDVSGSCALGATAVLLTNGPKLPTVGCTDNDADSIEFDWIMPDGWDGGTLTVELAAFSIGNNNAEVFEMDFAGQCVSTGDTPTAHSTTGEQSATITWGNAANREQHATTAVITLQGTCAAGDHVYMRGQVDATATTISPMTDLKILGAKVEYTRSGND